MKASEFIEISRARRAGDLPSYKSRSTSGHPALKHKGPSGRKKKTAVVRPRQRRATRRRNRKAR